MFCFAKCCRFCLNFNGTLVDYRAPDVDNISYLDKIMYINSHLINESDHNYPKWICFNCQEKLHITYKFIKKCLRSQQLLQKYNATLNSSNFLNVTHQKIEGTSRKKGLETDLLDNMDSKCHENMSQAESIDIVKHEFVDVNIKTEPEYDDPLPISEINVKCEIDTEFDNVVEDCGDSVDKNLFTDNNIFNNTSISPGTSIIEYNTVDRNEQIEQHIYVCNICNKKCETPVELVAHKTTHTENQQLKYNICNLTPNEKTENQSSQSICNKKLNASNSLNTHKKNHTEEKIYSCNSCNRKFSLESDLIKHTKIHTVERPYQCDVCDKKFIHISKLAIHKRIHTGEKPFSCDICDKKFISSSDFFKHKRNHTGEKPYSCDICDKKFNRMSNLNRHKITHTGETPYSCDLCDKKYSFLSNLSRHRRIHTGERPYVCDICDRTFIDSSNLINHKKTHAKKTHSYDISQP